MIKKHALTLSGLVIMVFAFAWSVLFVDEAVPNDANIGAGILFIAGIAVVIAGVATTCAMQPCSRPTRTFAMTSRLYAPDADDELGPNGYSRSSSGSSNSRRLTCPS